MNYWCPAVIADGPPLFIKTSFSPLDYSGSPKSFVLNGVADYKKDGSSNGELISLRLEQFGDDNGVDFYLGYNRKAGVNSGVSQGADQVILYSKDRGKFFSFVLFVFETKREQKLVLQCSCLC